MRHGRCGVDEGVLAGVEVRAERLDAHGPRQLSELLLAKALLHRDQPDPCDLRKRREGDERDGAGAVRLRMRIALPGDADLEAGRTDSMRPFFDQSRFGAKIRRVRGRRVESGAKGVRKTADRDLGVEQFVRWRVDEARHDPG